MSTALHLHSEFSFLAGVPTIKELVSTAKKLGYNAVHLADQNRMSGLILFYQECRSQGLKPLLGVELTDPKKPSERVVLVARSAEGYGDLCEIITQLQLYPDRFTFEKTFSQAWPQLFFLTASTNTLRLLSASPNRARTFAELIRHSAEHRAHGKIVVELADQLSISCIASQNAFFLHRSDHELHQILRAIDLNSTLSRLRKGETAAPEAYLMSPAQMQDLFSDKPEALINAERLANECNVELSLNTWIMPQINVPKGYTPDRYLEKKAWEGFEKNYGPSANAPEYARAKKIQTMELEVIAKLGFSSYFLMVQEIRDWANHTLAQGYRRPKDCTILRGSAANSLTFYNLGVSDLDPIRYDLYFQRFLNEDRASPPDADLDFGWDEREGVLDHVAERFGRERVAITCTTNHFRQRAAFREVAKVFGFSEEQVRLIHNSQGSKAKRLHDDEIQRVLTWAQKVKGRPRFLGQHPGGVLITNQPIARYVACEWSRTIENGGFENGGTESDPGKIIYSGKNRIITQIDMHNGLDELGLIKFDLLGNGSLSVLRDTLAQIEAQKLPDPEVWDLEKCYADPRVQEIIRRGRTRGIFYIESPAQTRLNKKANAENFDEITVTSSLIRPAGTAYTQTYVDRHRKFKQGIVDWDFLHPSLEPILKASHDVCAFQEDVTKICCEVAGLTYKKADRIRKMMNSQHDGALATDEFQATAYDFMQGCQTHSGLNTEQAATLWKRVSSFTGFSFCKSHSASYAQLSFRCTYLKGYYPAQFLSAVISNNHGFYHRAVYLNEARRWGLRILPLSINESRYKYWGMQNWIRPGLMHVRSLRTDACTRMLIERNTHGPFRNLENFLQRVSMHKAEVERLILAGAFNEFGLTQPESLYILEEIHGKFKSDAPDLFTDNSTSIFFGSPNSTTQKNASTPEPVSASTLSHWPKLQEYSLMRRCLNERNLLGYVLSGDFLDILDLQPAAREAVAAVDIPRYVGKRIKVLGMPVTDRLHYVVKSGKPMKFLTLEDKSECMDVIFWPQQLERFADILTEPGPFEVWGKVMEDGESFSIVAESVKAVEWNPVLMDFARASERLKTGLKKYETYADIKQTLAA